MTYRTMEQFEKRYFPKGREDKGWRWIERTPAELDVENRIGELLKRQGRREVPG